MKKKSKRMSQKDYEKSTLDKKVDKITGFKEGSKKDEAMDKAISSKMRGKKYRKPKRSAGIPATSRNPFGTIKSDAGRAGKQFMPGILSQKSGQTRLHTGKTLLAKAMKREARYNRKKGR